MYNDSYFKTDRFTEPFNALIITDYFVSQIKTDEYATKWAIITMHNSLQGFMTLALRDSDGFQIIKKTSRHKEKDIYAILSDPKNKLDNFLNLFEKIQDSRFMEHYIHSNTFVCDDEVKKYIEWLNEIRNSLIHYLPSSHLISFRDCFHSLSCSLKVICFLVNESNNFTHHYEPQEIEEINHLINKINQNINIYMGE